VTASAPQGPPHRPHGAAGSGEAFAARYDFTLDDFQVEGITALSYGRSTLVAAPTGAGKTVVGEFAVWSALETGGKCFYTTPIKALSNQKFADLTARHGSDQVGLLTGDNAINGDAPVVVMTTEVLRNMLYERSPALVGLQTVVLDEVHYLADRERGAVWEEVIIQLPASVTVACLSATVSNAEEFGAWLASVRSSCDVVISEHRPVPLSHHYAINDELYAVFADDRDEEADGDQDGDERRPNPKVVALERRAARRGKGAKGGHARKGRGGPAKGGGQPPGVRLRRPKRSELIVNLRRRDWLPAIYFVFSRAGCDDAVEQVVGDGVQLTTGDERRRIRRIIDERTATLPAEDLEALDVDGWAAGCEAGVAAHHAGLVPVFKQVVEELFAAGLVKVCFATETLALGINMPARTVVVERLEKWDGRAHHLLTPGEFTQLTGRAGRRGLDRRGHAVVCYQRDVDFPTVASLVGRRTEPLVSRFAPSYNMAVNLLRSHDRSEAEALLSRSFAQYQADQRVASDKARIADNHGALAGYAANLVSEYGDFAEYWGLRRELARLEEAEAEAARRRAAEAIEEGLRQLEAGDVFALPDGQHGAGSTESLLAVVGQHDSRKGTPVTAAVTEDRKLIRISPYELEAPPRKVGTLALPAEGGPRRASYRKVVANTLRRMDASPADAEPGASPATLEDDGPSAGARLHTVREAVRNHPVAADPALSEIEVWARRSDELADETAKLEARVNETTGSLVSRLDRTIGLLAEMGYLTADPADPTPTDDGLMLATLYTEADLVLAEVLRAGILEALDAPGVAAVASVLVHETRQKDAPPPRHPTASVAEGCEQVIEQWRRVTARERQAGLPVSREPDAGFIEAVWRWASGADFDEALSVAPTPGGDFVRSAKQVADLSRQIRDATGSASLARSAGTASSSLVRGVVAYTGV
jgi:ATP-dependent RNA helicase HelY